MVDRVPTYIPSLDKLVEGGFPKGSIILISGTPGTGKSIFCAQIAYNNALKGKKCLYLNLEQNEGRLENQMAQFGWDADKATNLKLVSVDSSDPKLVEYVLKEIKNADYDMVVLDSLDSISSNPVSVEELGKPSMESIAQFTIPTLMDSPTIGRIKLKKIFSALAQSHATALLTSERVQGALGLSRDTIAEFLSDAILTMDYIEIGVADYRTMAIRKIRSSNHYKDLIPFDINSKGITIREKELKP